MGVQGTILICSGGVGTTEIDIRVIKVCNEKEQALYIVLCSAMMERNTKDEVRAAANFVIQTNMH